MASEAVRLAAAPADLAPVQQGGNSAEAGWSRVRKLSAGDKIVVTIKGAWTARRSFVSADDTELVVSNETGQVERLARSDVAQIKKAPRVEKTAATVAVATAGGMVAMMAGGAAGAAAAHYEDNNVGAPLLGALVVSITYALVWRFFLFNSSVVYVAPQP
jgi:hypothetical protein